MPKPRRYSIEIEDFKGNSILFVAADWTEQEKRVAIAQIERHAMLFDDNYLGNAAEPPPKDGSA